MKAFNRIKKGLSKTRKSLSSKLDSVISSFTKIDEDLFEEIEEILVMADIGYVTTEKIIAAVKQTSKEQKLKNPIAIKHLIKEEMIKILGKENDEELLPNGIYLFVGVNGSGKTTTIGKIASKLTTEGKKVIVAAADTFRAAATNQLEEWAKRSSAEFISQGEGADPGAVVFDAIAAGNSRKTDVILCDTAGRLQNKKNLMMELEKINRIITREYNGNRNTFLVVDATTGMNGLSQAKSFTEIAEVTGIILTKMDGTAKGGIVITIADQLDIPVKYIGVGEAIDDLRLFNPVEFVDSIIE